MSELTLEKVIARLDNGCNPVELAGHGRESTHKGYLTWLLNTSHWPAANHALIRLVEAAVPHWPDRHRVSGRRWIQRCPDNLYTLYEQRVGNGKVDLIVRAGDGDDRDLLPIELKTDSAVGSDQLTRMSVEGSRAIGLVLLLGSSAVRDDILPQMEGRGCFAPLTLEQIIDAWQDLEVPPPGIDWLEALKHEQTRLTRAFQIGPDRRHWAYRDRKHLSYALLASVKKELHNRHSEFGSWKLYDGGYNTVLNLSSDSGWSWNRVHKATRRPIGNSMTRSLRSRSNNAVTKRPPGNGFRAYKTDCRQGACRTVSPRESHARLAPAANGSAYGAGDCPSTPLCASQVRLQQSSARHSHR
ncbi:hypothetical protein [Candidatus Rariloculus sp.]|uniref:hypothetical protein n=1 Tax=Candidatus Rariloculus sp. TaxID=3101265 RepID=UPI003D0FB872